MAEVLHLKNALRKGESPTLEFKREFPVRDKQYLKTIVAFANGNGGHMLFGVADGSGDVIGLPQDDIFRVMDSLTDAVADACAPPIMPEIRIRSIEGKTILDVEVLPGQNKPYYLKKEHIPQGVYVRVGATTRRAEPEQVQELTLQGRHQSYDELPSGRELPAPELIAQLLRQISLRSGKEVTTDNLLGWNVLIRRKNTSLPTNAFELLTRNPFHFATIQCACFKGTIKGIFIDKADLEGPVQEQIEQAYQFVLRHIRLEASVEGLYRVERYEIPEEALREAIINAVVHRNYLQHAYIQVAIYDDRLEIISPGGLYGGLTLTQAENGTSSIRNKVLADIFAKMKLVEHWGTGLLKMRQLCAQAHIPLPTFRDDETSFTVTFFRAKAGTPTFPATPPSKTALAANAQCILDYVRQHGSITNRQGRELTGLSVSGVRAILLQLEKSGHVIAVGDKKNRRYQSTETAPQPELPPLTANPECE
ncbi:MAG: ATP-binding protein [Akkermansia sp.]